MGWEVVTVNLGRGERVWRNGREYIRAPITSIVPGVLNGSKGALLYLPEDCEASVPQWDGQPLTYFHPTRNGVNVSAHERGVREQHWIGHVENTTFSGKLKKFGMFDVALTRKLDAKYGGDVLNRLESGEPIEMSTGLFTDNEDTPGYYNGKNFDAIARNYRPDHVAVLPGQKGACSVDDGCGVNVNQLVANTWSDEARAAAAEARAAHAAKTKEGKAAIAKSDHAASMSEKANDAASHQAAGYAHDEASESHGKLGDLVERSGPSGLSRASGSFRAANLHNKAARKHFDEARRLTGNALSSAFLGAGNRAPNALLDLTERERGGGGTAYEGGDGEPEQIKEDETGEDWIPKPDEPEDTEMRQQASLLHRMLSMLLGRAPTQNAVYSRDKKMRGYGITGQQVHDAAVSGAAPSARAGLIGDKAPQDGGRDADELVHDDNEIPAYDSHQGEDKKNDGEAGITGAKTSQSGGGTAPKAADIEDNCSTYMTGNEMIFNYIKKVGDRYHVMSHKGKSLGEYGSEAEAKKRLAQVEYFKHAKNNELVENVWSDEAREAAAASRRANAKSLKAGSGMGARALGQAKYGTHEGAEKEHAAAEVDHLKEDSKATGTPAEQSHREAAAAHGAAAAAHMYARKAAMTKNQSPATNLEADMADVLNLEGLSADQRAARLKELRPKMIKYLTTNCGCDKERGALPLINNETLAVLTVNKANLEANEKAQGSNADASGSGSFKNAWDTGRDDGDSGDGAETAEDEDDYLKGKKQDPNRAIAQAPPTKNQRRLTREEWMRLAPQEIQEATVNLLRREEGQKRQIASRLTAHISDDGQRKRLVANLLKKSLTELEDELVLHARPAEQEQQPFRQQRASYVGAAGGFADTSLIGNRRDDADDDVLEIPTFNLGMPVEEFNKKVDAFAKTGGNAA